MLPTISGFRFSSSRFFVPKGCGCAVAPNHTAALAALMYIKPKILVFRCTTEQTGSAGAVQAMQNPAAEMYISPGDVHYPQTLLVRAAEHDSSSRLSLIASSVNSDRESALR